MEDEEINLMVSLTTDGTRMKIQPALFVSQELEFILMMDVKLPQADQVAI